MKSSSYFYDILASLLLVSVVYELVDLTHAQDTKFVEYFFPEEQAPNAVVGDIAHDANFRATYDADVVNLFRYHFLDESDKRTGFAINERTGLLHTTHSIDRERSCAQAVECKIILNIAIRPVRYFQIIQVTVNIVDVNDNWPRFENDRVSLLVEENSLIGSSYPLPSATDGDAFPFGIANYELQGALETFRLVVRNSTDGSSDLRLVLLRQLDREKMQYFSLTVLAWDGGVPTKSGRLRVDLTVTDVNDNHPVFGNGTFDVTVSENVSPQTPILRVHATDADAKENGRITYRFSHATESTFKSMFGIDSTSGDVYVRSALDHAHGDMHTLTVIAEDGGRPPLRASRVIVIRVRDLNDHAPVIGINAMTSSGLVVVPEDAQAGTFVAHISVADGDSGRNSNVTCSLSGNKSRFRLQSLDGATNSYKLVTTHGHFDRAVLREYNLSVVCRDAGTPPLTTTRHVSIQVTDVNDHCPFFETNTYESTVAENSPSGTYVTRIIATDADEGENAAITYWLRGNSGAHQKWFDIDALTGVVRTRAQFDYELNREYELLVIATDHGEPPCSSTTSLSVLITDVNDEYPLFDQMEYTFDTHENEPSGTVVGTVLAIDKDSRPHNTVMYSLDATDGDDWRHFDIDEQYGVITTKSLLDTEMRDVLQIRVLAKNEGHATVGSTRVIINVLDSNDHWPVIDFPEAPNQTIDVSSTAVEGHVVARIVAHDLDRGVNAMLQYSIANGDQSVFNMNPQLGMLVLKQDLAPHNGRMFSLTVSVSDRGVPRRTAQTKLNVYVNDSLASAMKHEAPMMQRDIIIIVVCLSAFLIASIMAVLVVLLALRRRRRQHMAESNKYNCRVEAAKVLMSGSTVPCKDSRDHVSKKEVTFKVAADDDGGFARVANRPVLNGRIASPMSPTVMATFPSGEQSYSPARCSPCIVPSTSNIRCYEQRTPPPSRKAAAPSLPYVEDRRRKLLYGLPQEGSTVPLSRTQLQVHNLMVAADIDGDSDGGSLTDSGRGPSEEGEGRPPDPKTLLAPARSVLSRPPVVAPHGAAPKKAVTFESPIAHRLPSRDESRDRRHVNTHSAYEQNRAREACRSEPIDSEIDREDHEEDISDDDTTTSGSYVVDLSELTDADQTDCKYDVFV